MSIVIDGSQVALGDTLFSRRAGATGTVVKIADSAVTLRIVKGGGSREFTVTGNGLIAGAKDVYWYPTLELSRPLSKAEAAKYAKLQAILDVLVEVL